MDSLSPRAIFPHAEYLAKRGMVAVSAEYRVSSGHNTTLRESVMDGISAMRWIRQHAAELGVDPDRISAGGGSTGGQVAAAAANSPGFFKAREGLRISSRPNALILFNPVLDNGPDGYWHARAEAYWQDFSPLHNINADSPPTLVFLGTEDHLIPVETAIEYKRPSGTYPRSTAACRTRSRVFLANRGSFRKASETVDLSTPTASATWEFVIRGSLLIGKGSYLIASR